MKTKFFLVSTTVILSMVSNAMAYSQWDIDNTSATQERIDRKERKLRKLDQKLDQMELTGNGSQQKYDRVQRKFNRTAAKIYDLREDRRAITAKNGIRTFDESEPSLRRNPMSDRFLHTNTDLNGPGRNDRYAVENTTTSSSDSSHSSNHSNHHESHTPSTQEADYHPSWVQIDGQWYDANLFAQTPCEDEGGKGGQGNSGKENSAQENSGNENASNASNSANASNGQNDKNTEGKGGKGGQGTAPQGEKPVVDNDDLEDDDVVNPPKPVTPVKAPVPAKKPVAKKPEAKKPAPAKKPVAKKPAAKKPVAKKPAAKKPIGDNSGIKKQNEQDSALNPAPVYKELEEVVVIGKKKKEETKADPCNSAEPVCNQIKFATQITETYRYGGIFGKKNKGTVTVSADGGLNIGEGAKVNVSRTKRKQVQVEVTTTAADGSKTTTQKSGSAN